jgi:tyrosyl-tRNA synthetase
LFCVAEKDFLRQLKQKELPDGHMDSGESIWVCLLMCEAGLTVSNGQARRLYKPGGVKLNGEGINNADMENEPSGEVIIQAGTRRFAHVNFT